MQETHRAWKKIEKSIELQSLIEQRFLYFDEEGLIPTKNHSYLSSKKFVGIRSKTIGVV
jgi:hypothetical protein